MEQVGRQGVGEHGVLRAHVVQVAPEQEGERGRLLGLEQEPRLAQPVVAELRQAALSPLGVGAVVAVLAVPVYGLFDALVE